MDSLKRNQLQRARKELGLTLSKLSAIAPVSRWRLLEFEAGNIELKPEELDRIESALKHYAHQKMAVFSRFAEVI